ncbi:hypothetical protein GCM10007423_39320 [Dyadobacter endophyticus]|uniref:Uncharacterized protein n=2 Tax=Dyadobacter endophyticus TaxID=1749036 RepID=A0ABQ1YYQ5_9BACT|nr:hypothetical protein GCM10007423_39320 [Dyadobacter endophyticus]
MWENAYSISTPDGEKLVVPFTLENEIFVNGGSKNRDSYGSITRLLVSNEGGNYKFETATYLADYHLDSTKVSNEWSGQIIVENALGDFVDAFYVDNGKITGYAVKNSQNSRTNILVCYEIEYWSCAYVPLIGYYAPCQYMYSEFNHCYSSTPSATGSSGGYLTVIGKSGTSGSGGAPSPWVDRFSEISKMSVFSASARVAVNEILDNLMGKCLGKSLFVGLVSRETRIEWKIDPAGTTPGAYNPVNKTIKFQTESQISPNTLEEELFHAYQDKYYSGGTTQYLSTGSQNIEFESKLFRDIMGLIASGGGMSSFTVGEQYNNQYMSWLLDITDGATKVPATYSVVASQYFFWLDKFVQSNPLYNQPGMTTISTFTPGALFDLIDKSSCSKKP